jgi:hypothetical protein
VANIDLELLAYIAEHRFILGEHAQAFLGVRPYNRLEALRRAGLVEIDQSTASRCYSATPKGIREVGRTYSRRKITYDSYRHDVGLAWLWLAARAGSFGPVAEIITERAMRSRDRHAGQTAQRLAVRLGGGRHHYPDLLLHTPNGKRIAVELELSAKSRTQRERIIGAYAIDRRIDAVVYLVENRATGRAIQETARRAGISNLVHVQMIKGGLPPRDGPQRTAARAPDRGAPGLSR